MYCRHCGKPVPDDSKFCPGCGKAQEPEIKPVSRPRSTPAVIQEAPTEKFARVEKEAKEGDEVDPMLCPKCGLPAVMVRGRFWCNKCNIWCTDEFRKNYPVGVAVMEGGDPASNQEIIIPSQPKKKWLRVVCVVIGTILLIGSIGGFIFGLILLMGGLYAIEDGQQGLDDIDDDLLGILRGSEEDEYRNQISEGEGYVLFGIVGIVLSVIGCVAGRIIVSRGGKDKPGAPQNVVIKQ